MALEDLIGRRDQLPLPLERPHRVQFHNIIYITAGHGTHYIDFQPYSLSPGSMVFVAQGQVRAFDTNNDHKGYLVLFTANYLENNLIHSELLSLYGLYNYHLHTPVLSPQETRRENFHHNFLEIHREYFNQNHQLKEDILRLQLKTLLLKVERVKQTLSPPEKNTDRFSLFCDFREKIAEHYTSTRSVKEYAKMLKISPKHLNAVCKTSSGTTAKECIDTTLILEIKRVLATTDNSIQQLCYDFGFDEPTNFIKFFKRRTGKSPTKFRNAYKKDI